MAATLLRPGDVGQDVVPYCTVSYCIVSYREWYRRVGKGRMMMWHGMLSPIASKRGERILDENSRFISDQHERLGSMSLVNDTEHHIGVV
jgi:hypothetical protein